MVQFLFLVASSYGIPLLFFDNRTSRETRAPFWISTRHCDTHAVPDIFTKLAVGDLFATPPCNDEILIKKSRGEASVVGVFY